MGGSRPIEPFLALTLHLVFIRINSHSLIGTASPSYDPMNGRLLLQSTTTSRLSVGSDVDSMGVGIDGSCVVATSKQKIKVYFKKIMIMIKINHLSLHYFSFKIYLSSKQNVPFRQHMLSLTDGTHSLLQGVSISPLAAAQTSATLTHCSLSPPQRVYALVPSWVSERQGLYTFIQAYIVQMLTYFEICKISNVLLETHITTGHKKSNKRTKIVLSYLY